MAPIRSHIYGADESHNTFLVIFKIHGHTIQLWPRERMESIGKTQSFRVSCHDVKAHSDHPSSDIQVVTLAKPGLELDNCVLQCQHPSGEELNLSDMAIFMTSPVISTRSASYAIDLGVSKYNEFPKKSTIKETSYVAEDWEETVEKLGSAYLYLDPKFSSQGIQRTPIIAPHTHKHIGQMQVEYLIVTNPVAYGKVVPKPKWLTKNNQLTHGHRGAGSGRRLDLPERLLENTIASFNYAHRHGADMCELDVMCTADGVPVVYHNYTLDTSTTQIDELTLDQLRDLKDCIVHDKDCQHNKENCKFTQSRTNNSPFPTLEEVLREVDQTCGLNIELKWPQLLPSGKNEANQYREVNDFVDRILKCIFEHDNGRAIVLSTLNANIAIMLRLKQSVYPVLFLTTGDSKRFNDPATKTIENAIHFAQAFDMAGINPNAAHLTEYLVKNAQDRGLLVYAWGKIESAQAVKELKQTGLNGVIYDKIDLIKPQD